MKINIKQLQRVGNITNQDINKITHIERKSGLPLKFKVPSPQIPRLKIKFSKRI